MSEGSCALCGMRLLTVHKPMMLEVRGELLPFCPDASGCRRRAVAARAVEPAGEGEKQEEAQA